ncbi:ETS-related transcription factor Elf-5-like isoform X2 [Ceratina calcarata]|nr:ETS-related transcription factor Elf-5-like isoform X2 [Ceratina calcarata]XP_017886923.1 ETS-related transcription factor Elf-5-like isoform X2 [Ceratina calcarata]XP_026672679.1 ETS-related transcription factor Elf-5-like isoform X2 [Ceratina calcarata]
MYPSFPDLNDDDNYSVVDMDRLNTRRTNVLTTPDYEPVRKKCNFGDDDNEIDGTGWSAKPVAEWSQEETIHWLMYAASCIRQPYGLIQNSLAVPGNQLIHFTRDEFISRDPMFGNRLYDLLPSNMLLPPFDTIHPHSEDEYHRISSNSTSDAESDSNSIDISTTKRPPGRPRVSKKPIKKAPSQGKLWEFIRDLLLNNRTCPSLICWEDYSQAKFRFVKSDEVAKRWGSRKGNTNMTYEKLSRAMRYYYKSQIFLPVYGRRLVYQFGPNAKGWQTDNPNFRF